MAVYPGVVLVAVLMSSGGVGGQRLTFSPSTIVDGTTSSLTVRCDVSGTSSIFYIRLYKGETQIATYNGLKGSITVEPGFQQRATAAGSLDPPASAYLALTFNAAVSCSDAGDYRCEYAEAAIDGLRTTNQSVRATSNPGNIDMFVRPRLATYNVNESVELECAGEVGFPVVGSWRWETRDATFASNWTSIRASIQQTDDPNTGTGCQRRGRSTLRFQVQLEDDARMYRCSFRSDQYSANFTFQVRAPSPESTPPAVSTSYPVGGQRLTFTPSSIEDGTTSSLTVRCDVTETSPLYVIKLYKGTTRLTIGDSRGVRVDPPFQQRATAAGSLDPPASAYLALTFNAAVSCSDAGDYRCEYAAVNSPGSPVVNQSLPASSNPGHIQMLVRPRRPTYKVNDLVELVCAGEVGNPAAGIWRWETRDIALASNWTSIRPSIQQTDETPTASGVCQMRGMSTLRFQVQVEDDDRMYRCSFRSDQYSANFTFQVSERTC